MFALNEIYVSGVKLIEDRIWFTNVREIIPKDHPRVLEEGHKLVAKTSKRKFTYGNHSTATSLFNGLLVMGLCGFLKLVSMLQFQDSEPIDGCQHGKWAYPHRWGRHLSVVPACSFTAKLRVNLYIYPTTKNRHWQFLRGILSILNVYMIVKHLEYIILPNQDPKIP